MFSARMSWDGELAEMEDESRDAPAKLEKRAREPRKEDGTVPTVSVSELAILFVCEVGERRRRGNFRQSANLRRGLPADFARANNCFSQRIRVAWLRFARDLPE